MPRVERRAEERLERMLALNALIARLARSLGPGLDLQTVLREVLSAMRSIVDFRGGSVQLIDSRGVYVAAADPAVSDEVMSARVPVGTGISGRVVSTGRTLYSPNIGEDPRVDPELRVAGTNRGITSYLAVPLVVLREVIGVVQIDSPEEDAYDADDIITLEGLAAQVAGTIERARHDEQVAELDRMKGDFIDRISHELRTPLTIMGGFTDTLLSYGDTLSGEQRQEVLERIKKSIARLTTLIEEILEVSSFDAGVNVIHPSDVDLAGLLDEVRGLSNDPGRVDVVCEPGARVVSDAVMLRHVVNQLVDNALKYAGDATLTASSEEGHVMISVRDHGPGIPPTERERIFTRFYRGTHTGAGMGLGLPVARDIARQLNATVTVGDAPGGGALFTVKFS
ncbi:MAG TPA: GAF domain-containing sensor histidine kinase [Acidimicrobiales bacterium]|nr:GAF domain-containing sensor histidine kinase [Acidimicrobiales bacterium]